MPPSRLHGRSVLRLGRESRRHLRAEVEAVGSAGRGLRPPQVFPVDPGPRPVSGNINSGFAAVLEREIHADFAAVDAAVAG